MGSLTPKQPRTSVLFNSPLEIGLRALAVLTDAYPHAYSLQRLVILDYFLVHSDDLPGGPKGLHPKTPFRGAELLVRRRVLQEGLTLYQSRGLIEQQYTLEGVRFAATERSSSFLDVLLAEYVGGLRKRAAWLVESFGGLSDQEVARVGHENVDTWDAEFAMASVLWEGEDE